MGIVFKQRFNPVSGDKTPGLNVRHLQYIATRPGAVYNRGCAAGNRTGAAGTGQGVHHAGGLAGTAQLRVSAGHHAP